jgi:hypothetical protein
MTWKPHEAIPVFFAQVNERWPGRDKSSDGVVGDYLHQQRESDHNPDEEGWVKAMDIDKDLRGDPEDMDTLAEQLLEYARTRQPGSERLKNIVYKDRVASGTYADRFWVWRYDSSLEHFSHMHVSLTDGTENDDRLFDIPILMEDDPVALTQSEIDAIVEGVWNKAIKRPWDGKVVPVKDTLGSTHYYATTGGFVGAVPESALSRPGEKTTSAKILASEVLSLTDADVDRIAKAVVDLLKDRL